MRARTDDDVSGGSGRLRAVGSKRVGWRHGRVFPAECVENYPMVGLSPSSGPEIPGHPKEEGLLDY